MHHRSRLGQWGETAALQLLLRKGFVFMERNARTSFGELDLIMVDGNELVFVEVKTRQSQAFGTPAESVTRKKLQHLAASIAEFVETVGWKGQYRLDVVSVCVIGRKARLAHLRNVGG